MILWYYPPPLPPGYCKISVFSPVNEEYVYLFKLAYPVLYAFTLALNSIKLNFLFSDCKHFFNSTTANKSGTFNSSSWPGLYPLNSHCMYYFVGLQNERVELNITDFQLQGVYPQ